MGEAMGIFSKEEILFEKNDIRIGEFDPTNSTGTCYLNILKYPFNVKKNRVIRVRVTSELPIDVAVATQDGGGLLGEIGAATETTLGPFETKNYSDMCLFLGITPGNKSNVSVKVWSDSK